MGRYDAAGALLPLLLGAPAMTDLADVRDEYEFLEGDDRYRLLVDLGRALEAMP